MTDFMTISYKVDYTNTKNHFEYLLIRQNDKSEWKIIDFQYEFHQIEEFFDNYLVKTISLFELSEYL